MIRAPWAQRIDAVREQAAELTGRLNDFDMALRANGDAPPFEDANLDGAIEELIVQLCATNLWLREAAEGMKGD